MQRNRRAVRGVTLLVVCVLALGIAIVPPVASAAGAPAPAPAAPSTPPPANAPVTDPTYVLGPGDTLDIHVFGEPDLSGSVTIKPDGTVELALIHEVQAAGKTTGQLQDELKQMYGKYLKAPSVSIVVTQFRAEHIYLLGQVNKPGDYQLKPHLGSFEVLASAGGATTRADLAKAVIIRGKTQTIDLDLLTAIAKDNPPDVHLQDGDVLFIPETDRRIVVLGQVGRPGAYDLLEGQRTSDLLAAAGGLNQKAAMDKAFIVRNGAQTPLDLKRVMAGDSAANLPLQPGDMVVIPENKDRVTVVGAVGKPGPIDYEDNMTLIDAIAAAGGTTDKANLAGVQIVRFENGKTKNIPVKADQAMNGKDLSQNVKLLPADMVYVPNRGMNLLEILNQIGLIRLVLGF
jgi:polysaccharide biosynthesis/export protein